MITNKLPASEDVRESGNATRPVRGWFMVALLTIAFAFAMVDRTVMTILIGPIEHDLAISDTQFSLLQGLAFALFYACAGLPLGYLVDRVSRIYVVTIGLAVWSGATVLSAFAGSFSLLFAARTAVAVGEASINPAAYSLLSDVFPKEKLGRAIGIFSCGAAIGVGMAYLLGGVLLSAFRGHAPVHIPFLGALRVWQVAFLLAGLPGLFLAGVISRLPEPPRKAVRRVTPAAPAGALVRFFASHRAALLTVYGASALQVLLLYAFMTWSAALLLRDHKMAPPQVAAIMVFSSTVFGLLGFVVGGGLADRWWKAGRKDAHMRVGFWAHCAILPTALAVALAPQVAVVAPALCLLNFLQVGVGPAVIAGLQMMTPQHLRGRVSAILITVTTVAGVGFGPLSVALLNDHVFDGRVEVGKSLATVVVVVCPIAILLFQLGRRRLADAISAAEQER